MEILQESSNTTSTHIPKANETPITDELRDLLGPDVVLLSLPERSKGTKAKWGHLTKDHMTLDHLKKCERGNIGVALGEKSGGLIAIDIDEDEFVPTFLAANSRLEETLVTHGARGRVFWLKMVGDYPNRVVKLKTRDGKNIGEWRAGKNSYSIIHGVHPKGHQYQFINKVKPLELEFCKIIWPTMISNPPESGQLNAECTEETEETEAIETADGNRSGSGVLPSASVKSVEHAVELSLPSQPHENHASLFTLARAVKALEQTRGSEFTNSEKQQVFNLWYKQSTDYLKSEQSRDEYLFEFLEAYEYAKYPLGEDGLKVSWRKAQDKGYPPEAEQFESGEIKLLVSLCCELQTITGDAPFYLSCRTVLALFRLGSPTTAAKWLKGLVNSGVIRVHEKGGPELMKATRYFYIQQVPDSEPSDTKALPPPDKSAPVE